MRILTVTNLYPPEGVGGWELGCAQMVEALRQRGHDVRVLTSTPRTFENGGDDAPHVRRLFRVEESWDKVLMGADAPDRLVRRLLVEPHNIDIFRQEVEAFEPDIVYFWNLVGLGAAGLLVAAKLRGIPWAVHLMDAMPRYVVSTGIDERHFARLLFGLLSGTWISCSDRLLEEIQSVGARLSGNVIAIPNWVTGPAPRSRTSWYQPGTTLRCVYTGQIASHKGIAIMLQSVAALRTDGYTVEVDLFGDGPDRDGFEASAVDLGIVDAVRFRGQVSQRELFEQLPSYDVMLFPTEVREPFGFAPLEAAAVGCVPVVTGGAGITEWLVSDVHLLTAPRSIEGFTSALRRILEGETQLEPIGRRAQRLIHDEMHVDIVARRVEDALRSDTANPRGEATATWNDIGRMARLSELVIEDIITSGVP